VSVVRETGWRVKVQARTSHSSRANAGLDNADASVSRSDLEIRRPNLWLPVPELMGGGILGIMTSSISSTADVQDPAAVREHVDICGFHLCLPKSLCAFHMG